MLEFIDTLIKEHAYWFGFISSLIGILAGNKLAIGRDKRKEHNDLAIKLSKELLKQIDLVEEKDNGFGGVVRGVPIPIGNDEILEFSLRVNCFRRKRLLRAYKFYKGCFVYNKYPDVQGTYHYMIKNSNYVDFKQRAKDLLKVCRLI